MNLKRSYPITWKSAISVVAMTVTAQHQHHRPPIQTPLFFFFSSKPIRLHFIFSCIKIFPAFLFSSTSNLSHSFLLPFLHRTSKKIKIQQQQWRPYSLSPSTTFPPTTRLRSARACARSKVSSRRSACLLLRRARTRGAAASSTRIASHRQRNNCMSWAAILRFGSSSSCRMGLSGMLRCALSIAWIGCWGRRMMGRMIC